MSHRHLSTAAPFGIGGMGMVDGEGEGGEEGGMCRRKMGWVGAEEKERKEVGVSLI